MLERYRIGTNKLIWGFWEGVLEITTSYMLLCQKIFANEQKKEVCLNIRKSRSKN